VNDFALRVLVVIKRDDGGLAATGVDAELGIEVWRGGGTELRDLRKTGWELGHDFAVLAAQLTECKNEIAKRADRCNSETQCTRREIDTTGEEPKLLPALDMRSQGEFRVVPPHLRCRTGGGGRLCAPSLHNERSAALMFRRGDGIHDPDTGKGRCGKHSCFGSLARDRLKSEILQKDNCSICITIVQHLSEI